MLFKEKQYLAVYLEQSSSNFLRGGPDKCSENDWRAELKKICYFLQKTKQILQ